MAGTLITLPRRLGEHAVEWTGGVLSSWRFPLFAISLLVSGTLAMFAILLYPAAPDGFGAFAEDFKVWCFGYDPATGSLQWAYVVSTALQPLVLGALIIGVWWRPLAEAATVPRSALARWCGTPLLVVALAVITLPRMGWTSEAHGDLPFPAESLRTSFAAPSFSFANQHGDPVSLEDLRGQVVLVTGVYATCGYTCPMIMGQARRVVAGLTEAERAGVRVVAITLDPHNDDRERLQQMAAGQDVDTPIFHLVNGEPAHVERTLDAFQIARKRDPATGIIDHANLFILIDRQGRVAYRLTLGERQERWLGTALRLLLREAPPPEVR